MPIITQNRTEIKEPGVTEASCMVQAGSVFIVGGLLHKHGDGGLIYSPNFLLNPRVFSATCCGKAEVGGGSALVHHIR